LPARHTYYTRPMSPAWSTPFDIDRLGSGETDREFAVPLAELPRLRSQFAGVGGSVDGRIHFAREAGFVVAELHLHGIALLQCQRCLRPMEQPVEAAARVALVTDEAGASRVPDDLEPVLAAGGRISVGELIEEELLLTLPLVPMHAPGEQCASESEGARQRQEAPAETTQRPFERLSELLKR
jgi:uncharacterized protein